MHADHVIVTMATANQVALMSLAVTWWKETIGQLGALELRADTDELLRGAAYLMRAWDPTKDDYGRLMLGVGDQLSATGVPRLYEDFGDAEDALQVRAGCAIKHLHVKWRETLPPLHPPSPRPSPSIRGRFAIPHLSFQLSDAALWRRCPYTEALPGRSSRGGPADTAVLPRCSMLLLRPLVLGPAPCLPM